MRPRRIRKVECIPPYGGMCSTSRQGGRPSRPPCRTCPGVLGVKFRESWYLFHSGSSRLRNARQGTPGRDRRNGDRSRPPSRTSPRRDPVGPAGASSQPPSREEDLRRPRSHPEGRVAARDPAARRNRRARRRSPAPRRVPGPRTPHAGTGPGRRRGGGRPDPPGDACGTAPPPARKADRRQASGESAVETETAVRIPLPRTGREPFPVARGRVLIHDADAGSRWRIAPSNAARCPRVSRTEPGERETGREQ